MKKIKNRFIMMTKKKSTGWARMKLLLLLPVVALSVYAFARPDGTRQLEQVIRSEITTITPINQNYSFEFFEAELNKFISEQGVDTALSPEEKRNFLTEKTNISSLFVNSKDEIIFSNKPCPIEELSSELTKKLIAKPNEKPVLIYMLTDRGTSFKVTTEILNIVGKAFNEQKNSDNQKNQPTLLQFGGPPKKYSPKNISDNSPKTSQFSVTFIDKDNELRSFTLGNQNHTQFINEIKEWLENQKDAQNLTTNVETPINTPMGLIFDLKTILRENNALKISYTVK